jgi:ferric-chelate reductase (NADPH)
LQGVSTLKARLLDGWLGDRFLRELQVQSLQPFGDRFISIRVQGAPLRENVPRPGDKVQIHVPGAGARTFSPYACDASDGSCSLLAHVQKESPAGAWLRQLEPGARLRWFGPSRSIELEALEAPLALFGDETSFGVASAARQLAPATLVRLELSAPFDGALDVASALGFPQECLTAKESRDAHLPAIARVLAEATARGGTIVLTGQARSIQTLRGLLKATAPGRRQAVKAYWAEGKAGLD